MILHLLAAAALAPALFAVVYYLFLAAWARPRAASAAPTADAPRHSFAIVIPAHDEEETLGATLAACAALDYPNSLVRVYVVADNCSDRTADVARAHGATCLERHDAELRGKGYALAWGFERVLADGPDAVVVLDADCRFTPNALQVFDRHMQAGERVLQASYVAGNPDDSAVSYALAVGNATENLLFYAPKSRLGLAVLLRGTGMVFHRDILARHPWNAHSITEDTEYTLTLLGDGIPVRFVPEVEVTTAAPIGQEQLRVQRARWSTGNAQCGKRFALRLLLQGLTRGRLVLLDAGWTLLVLSRPLVMAFLVAAFAPAALAAWLDPGPVSWALLGLTLATSAALAGYFALGVALVGVTRHRLTLLLGSPRVALRLVSAALAGLVASDRLGWQRTPRAEGRSA